MRKLSTRAERPGKRLVFVWPQGEAAQDWPAEPPRHPVDHLIPCPRLGFLSKQSLGAQALANLEEVFIKISGVQHDLWRAVDQDGIVLNVLVQSRHNTKAARRFFKKLLKGLRYMRDGLS